LLLTEAKCAFALKVTKHYGKQWIAAQPTLTEESAKQLEEPDIKFNFIIFRFDFADILNMTRRSSIPFRYLHACLGTKPYAFLDWILLEVILDLFF
jgi:hypothetical protein